MHNIDSSGAVIDGDVLPQAHIELAAAAPASLELIHERHDLEGFADSGSSIRSLRLVGAGDGGRIQQLTGLEAFAGLERLEIRAPVVAGYKVGLLPRLESCDLFWQEDAVQLLRQPNVKSVVLSSLGGTGAEKLSAATSLISLWLDRTTLPSLHALNGLVRIENFRVSNAQSLHTLEGLPVHALRSIDIERAGKLVDLSILASAESLESIRLVDVSEAAQSEVVLQLRCLKRIHLAGRCPMPVPWLSLCAMGAVELIAAPWDPSLVDEAQMAGVVEKRGRRIRRFESIGKRGVRPLIVEID